MKQMVPSFMLQEMKNMEITEEKVWEAEKCPYPPQDIHFLIPAICSCYLIWRDAIKLGSREEEPVLDHLVDSQSHYRYPYMRNVGGDMTDTHRGDDDMREGQDCSEVARVAEGQQAPKLGEVRDRSLLRDQRGCGPAGDVSALD